MAHETSSSTGGSIEEFEREKAVSWLITFHSELWSIITRRYAVKLKMELFCHYDVNVALFSYVSSKNGKQQTQQSNENGDRESMIRTFCCIKWFHCVLNRMDDYLNEKNKGSQSNVNSSKENISCDGFTSHIVSHFMDKYLSFLVFAHINWFIRKFFATIGEFHLKFNGNVQEKIGCVSEINDFPVTVLQVSNLSTNCIAIHPFETGFVVVLMVQRTHFLNFQRKLFATGRGRYVNSLIVLSLAKNHCLPSNAQSDGSIWYRPIIQIVKLEIDKSAEIDLVQNIRLIFSDLQGICSVVSKSKKIRSVYSEWMEFHFVLSDQKIHTVFCELERRVVHHGNGLRQLRTDEGGLKNFCRNWMFCLGKFVYHYDPYNIVQDGDVENILNEVEVGTVSVKDPINSFYQKVYTVRVKNGIWKIGQAVSVVAMQLLTYQLGTFWWIRCIIFTDAVKRTLITVEMSFSIQWG